MVTRSKPGIIPICFSTNDRFVPYMSVAMQSVMANSSKEANIRFYILHETLLDSNKRMLNEQVQKFSNFSIEFLCVSEFLEGRRLNNLNYGRESFFRVLIPYLLPEFKQIVYLDCDVVCLGDISELIDDHIPDTLLKASLDFYIVDNGESHVSRLGIKEQYQYFNAGVLVYNTEKFRREISLDDLFNLDQRERLDFQDQDVLNILCQGKISFNDISWNVMSENMPFYFKKKFYKIADKAIKQPNIIHYVWDKPWNYFYISERNKHFWKYARETAFADQLYAGLKNSSLEVNNGNHTSIFRSIEKGEKYDFRFIVKCGLYWLKCKLKGNSVHS